jgi:hypothetical protein
MYSSVFRRKSAWQLFALTIVVTLSTGCCLRPFDNMRVDSPLVEFFGFGMKPNELVTIQAKGGGDPSLGGEWETVGYLVTEPLPTATSPEGLDYYCFWSPGVYIPEHLWDRVGDGRVTAIRCIDSNGRKLFSANESIVNAGFEALNLDPVAGWLEYGNRNDYITVWRD